MPSTSIFPKVGQAVHEHPLIAFSVLVATYMAAPAIGVLAMAATVIAMDAA